MKSLLFRSRTLVFDDMGEGIPLLFIHPPGMGRVTFKKQHVLAKHFRLILPDLSGHGDSISEERFISVDTYVEEMKEIIDYLELSTCVLIGYSAGGVIAQKFASLYQNRVSTLILIGGYSEVTDPRLKVMHLMGMKMVRRHPDRLAAIISKVHTTNKADREELLHHMKKTNPEIWYHYYKQSLYYRGVEEVEKLSIPILLVYGEKSDWINNQLKCYNNCFPKKVYMIPGATHQIPTRYHDALNNILLGEIRN
ncbi:alpha/beta fold hydrolase [Rossellomorea aquimaris]|uniref:alpha/beta fold hydrolase n=1 Tax=Rossellomorea aquimaris TaxID=189382 RepID=UPI0007D0850C|nr:alpha/beta hydrolase [Rossellomorea aquimaris]